MAEVRITAEMAANCQWELEEITPDYTVWLGRGTDPVTGVPILVKKKEYRHEAALLKQNTEARNDSMNRRWSEGSGSEKGGNVPMVPVASIPLNIYYRDIVPYLQKGDDDHFKWWLNREENQPYRKRDGKV